MKRSTKSWRLWTVLFIIIFYGVALRIILAPTAINGDAHITQGWMESAVKLGVAASYDTQVNGTMLPTYPPVSLYIFWGAGQLYRFFVSADYSVLQPMHLMFVKLPAIATDIIMAIALWCIFWTWKRPKFGLIAAAIMAFHPAAIYNSTIWGQTDGVFTCVVLLGLLAFIRGYINLGLCLAVVAAFIKPQAIAFLPLAFFMVPLNRTAILKAVFWVGCTVLAVFLPFFVEGNVMSIVRVYKVFDLLGETRVSWNAYNMWWMFMGPHALNIPGGTEMIFGISYRTIGLLLFAIITIGSLWLLRTRLRADLKLSENGYALVLAATMSACAFFLFNAEMHERYYYPVIALALPICFIRPRYAVIYTCISLGYLFNMLGVFPYSFIDQFFFARIPNFSVLIATFQIVLFFMLLPAVLWYDKHVLPYVVQHKKTWRSLRIIKKPA